MILNWVLGLRCVCVRGGGGGFRILKWVLGLRFQGLGVLRFQGLGVLRFQGLGVRAAVPGFGCAADPAMHYPKPLALDPYLWQQF